MPPSPPASDLERLIEVGAYWKHRLVLTAAKLDLFTFLSERPQPAAAVAAHCRGDRQAFDVFLAALAGLGLLEKSQGCFCNTAFSTQYLVATSPEYRGDQLLVDDAYWGLWGDLDRALTTGLSPLNRPLFHDSPETATRLLRGLHRDALSIAPTVVEEVPLGGAKRLLDLGGGAGTYSMAYCNADPGLRTTIFDLPIACRVARATVKEAGLEGRIDVVEGDFLSDPLPPGHDALLLCNVLHGQGKYANEVLFGRVGACLLPGGRIIVRDVVMDPDLTSPAWGSVFAVNMLLHTGAGRCYSFEEISGWMAKAGFSDITEVISNSVITAELPVRAGAQ